MAKNPNPFLTDITLETQAGKQRAKVIILNETDKALVYIPLKALSRIDYNRFKEMHAKSELDLLTTMRDEKLDNGRNALVVYKNVIGVQNKEQPKAEDPVKTEEPKAETQGQEEEKPKRRGPGRPPKKKTE